MFRILGLLVLFLALLGCETGVYKVSKADYQAQVKTLGVLPLLVDGRSRIDHPEGGAILTLVRRAADGLTPGLIEELRKKKGYFDVRLIDEPPRLLAEELLRELRSDDQGRPLGHRLDAATLGRICKDAVVDGVLVLSLQGVVHKDKRWSRNTLENLTTNYNDIMATATVVAADGRVLWEMSGADAVPILPLQYPDFDEAYYNKTDKVKLKFISFPGLEKTLLPPAEGKDARPSSPQLAEWLQKVAAALSPSIFR